MYTCAVTDQTMMSLKYGKNKNWGTRTDSWLHSMSLNVLIASSVINYWTDARQQEIYLFYIVINETNQNVDDIIYVINKFLKYII